MGRRRGLRVGRGCPHLSVLGGGSTAGDGSCAARSVWVRRRTARTRSDCVDGRPMRNAAEHPLASLCRDERKGGSIGSYALRVFDDTRDLKDSRRRRNPELNGVSASRRHTTPTRGITQGTFMSLIYRRGRGMGKGGGRERGGLAGEEGWGRGRKEGSRGDAAAACGRRGLVEISCAQALAPMRSRHQGQGEVSLSRCTTAACMRRL